MRTLNLIISTLLLTAGILFTAFMWTQDPGWNIGVAIGVVLLLNGLVRLVFALGDGDGNKDARNEW